jgi:octaprenyl-diphosphate synthase
MNPASLMRPAAPPLLQQIYAPVRAELDQTETLLKDTFASDFAFVDRLVKHGFRLGGKRLRPALVLLTGRACGGIVREHVVLAAVVEMVHTASLIHDDVLDEATLRRHLETVNARWDNEASVLLGDYLYARSMCLAASLDSVYASRALAEASRILCEGELRQVGNRGNFDLSEDEYLEIVGAKTAALCSCCCLLGAKLAHADDATIDAMARYGQLLGVAFQIIDDVLDVRGTEDVAGKSLGTDLVKQKPTLPLIRLLTVVDPAERPEILRILAQGNGEVRREIAPLLAQYDTVAYAQSRALEFLRQAKDSLDEAGVSGPLDELRQLADFVAVRQQ